MYIITALHAMNLYKAILSTPKVLGNTSTAAAAQH